jgi:hypothetical protein
MYEVGSDLLRVASFALVAHGHEEMGENLPAVCADLSHFVFATSAWLISLKYLLAR